MWIAHSSGRNGPLTSTEADNGVIMEFLFAFNSFGGGSLSGQLKLDAAILMESMNRGHVISKGLPDDGMNVTSRMTLPRNGNLGPWNRSTNRNSPVIENCLLIRIFSERMWWRPFSIFLTVATCQTPSGVGRVTVSARLLRSVSTKRWHVSAHRMLTCPSADFIRPEWMVVDAPHADGRVIRLKKISTEKAVTMSWNPPHNGKTGCRLAGLFTLKFDAVSLRCLPHGELAFGK